MTSGPDTQVCCAGPCDHPRHGGPEAALHGHPDRDQRRAGALPSPARHARPKAAGYARLQRARGPAAGLADGSTCSMHRQCQGKCGSSSQIYQSQAALIRKQTDALVNEINNNATIVTQTANSQAGLVDKTAEVPLTPILRLCMHAWPALCPVPRMRGADKASLTHATLELPYMTPMWLHTTGSLGVLAGCSPFLWLARAGLCPCDGVVCAQQWAGTAVQCIECHKRQVGLTS